MYHREARAASLLEAPVMIAQQRRLFFSFTGRSPCGESGGRQATPAALGSERHLQAGGCHRRLLGPSQGTHSLLQKYTCLPQDFLCKGNSKKHPRMDAAKAHLSPAGLPMQRGASRHSKFSTSAIPHVLHACCIPCQVLLSSALCCQKAHSLA